MYVWAGSDVPLPAHGQAPLAIEVAKLVMVTWVDSRSRTGVLWAEGHWWLSFCCDSFVVLGGFILPTPLLIVSVESIEEGPEVQASSEAVCGVLEADLLAVIDPALDCEV
jgi:hypothetical protein